MESKAIIELYKDAVVQIATPYSTGTGFYIKKYNLIITNEHVVHDNKKVIIKGNGHEKHIVDVIYIDQKYDLAFLAVPDNYDFPEIKLGIDVNLVEGDIVLAVGHPFGLKYSATRGIISNTQHKENNTEYLQHDAALNPGNSGGPLIDELGRVIGVNTFIIRDGNNIGFSLPVHYVISTIEAFLKEDRKCGARCESCLNIVFENKIESGYCPYCGYKLEMISDIDDYEPFGVNKVIENLLTSIGINVELCRRGPNYWEITENDTILNIQYIEDYNVIDVSSLVCIMPNEDIKKLYQYILSENNKLGEIVFSISNQYVILSLKLMSQDLKSESMKLYLQQFREKLSLYNKILIGEYHGTKYEI